MSQPKKQSKTYEQMVLRLEEIADELEQGDLPLEESVRVYREALKLSAACSKLLEKYRQEITAVTEEGEEALDETAIQPDRD